MIRLDLDCHYGLDLACAALEAALETLYAPDSFGLGTLVYEAFNSSFMSTDRLGQPGKIPASMTAPYKRLINTNPKLRLSAGHFVEQGKKSGGFFETPLIHITEGAESLGLKNEAERDEFLNDLEKLTDDFPNERSLHRKKSTHPHHG